MSDSSTTPGLSIYDLFRSQATQLESLERMLLALSQQLSEQTTLLNDLRTQLAKRRLPAGLGNITPEALALEIIKRIDEIFAATHEPIQAFRITRLFAKRMHLAGLASLDEAWRLQPERIRSFINPKGTIFLIPHKAWTEASEEQRDIWSMRTHEEIEEHRRQWSENARSRLLMKESLTSDLPPHNPER